MNERIRQLVKQAGGHFSTHNLMSNPVQHRESIELWDNNIEKFAELLVAETLNKINASMEFTWPEMEVKIKEHFGVRV